MRALIDTSIHEVHYREPPRRGGGAGKSYLRLGGSTLFTQKSLRGAPQRIVQEATEYTPRATIKLVPALNRKIQRDDWTGDTYGDSVADLPLTPYPSDLHSLGGRVSFFPNLGVKAGETPHLHVLYPGLCWAQGRPGSCIRKIASYHRQDRKKRKKKVGEIEETCLTGASEEGRVILISREKSHWFLDREGGHIRVIAYIRPPYDSTGFSLHVLYCRYGYHLYVTL